MVETSNWPRPSAASQSAPPRSSSMAARARPHQAGDLGHVGRRSRPGGLHRQPAWSWEIRLRIVLRPRAADS